MEYKIGIIKNTHGLKGEIVVKSTTDFERFAKDKTIYFYEKGEKTFLTIKKTYNSKKGLIVLFTGYEDINLVSSFKGKELYTDEEPSLTEDEYHEDDIIGKDVYNQEGSFIGKVKNVMDVPQGYIIRIQLDDKEALVPFNDYFIISVNSDKIVINEIEGLLWKLM